MSLEERKGGVTGFQWKDIIEARLAHIEVKLDSPGAYQWRAETHIDKDTFTALGFTPGAAVEALYSYMIRHYDRLSDKQGELGEIT